MPRMAVNAVIGPTDPRYEKAMRLFTAAGYEDKHVTELEEIHCLGEEHASSSCLGEEHAWISNGFLQVYSNVGGERCRVCIYFPTQELQPHKHDVDEDFLITHGSVDMWTFSEAFSSSATHQKLEKGQRMIVPNGTIHSLRADAESGLVFHELVGEQTFKKRATEWQETLCPGRYIMPSVFAGRTVLVTGANRGLGLGFVVAFQKLGAKVVACCRDPSKAEELNALDPKPLILALDVASESSVLALPGSLNDYGIVSLDYLINNAGISSRNHPHDPILESSVAEIKGVFDVNVVGTIMVTKACLPFLKAGDVRTVMNLSSQLASIDKCWGIQGRYGGVCSYRISRAASNMALRCFGGELREDGYVFVAMSPGHVATDMGSAGGRTAPLTVDQSVTGMLKVLSHLARDDNGKFLQYDGAELPW